MLQKGQLGTTAQGDNCLTKNGLFATDEVREHPWKRKTHLYKEPHSHFPLATRTILTSTDIPVLSKKSFTRLKEVKQNAPSHRASQEEHTFPWTTYCFPKESINCDLQPPRKHKRAYEISQQLLYLSEIQTTGPFFCPL